MKAYTIEITSDFNAAKTYNMRDEYGRDLLFKEREEAEHWLRTENYTANKRVIEIDVAPVEYERAIGSRNAETEETRYISLDNGNTLMTAAEAMEEIENRNLWDLVTEYMDDETREAVHDDFAPCTDQEFLTEYLRRASDNLIIG